MTSFDTFIIEDQARSNIVLFLMNAPQDHHSDNRHCQRQTNKGTPPFTSFESSPSIETTHDCRGQGTRTLRRNSIEISIRILNSTIYTSLQLTHSSTPGRSTLIYLHKFPQARNFPKKTQILDSHLQSFNRQSPDIKQSTEHAVLQLTHHRCRSLPGQRHGYWFS